MAARFWRLGWLFILVGHGLVAVGWWWLQAGGFGMDHPRFWSNRVLPPVVLGLSVAALAALRVERMAAHQAQLHRAAAATGWGSRSCR